MFICFFWPSQKGSLVSSGSTCAAYSRVQPVLRSRPWALEETVYRALETLWRSAVSSVRYSQQCADSRNACRDNYPMRCLWGCNRTKTELLLFVPWCFIWVEDDSADIVDFRPLYAGGAAVNIYATKSSELKDPNVLLRFYFSWELGNYVGKNFSLPHRATLCLIFFKRRRWYLWYGAGTPAHCLLSCSVLIFFWNCL